MTGYSKTPLWKKLGIKEGYRCFLFQSPTNYFDLLEAPPRDTIWEEQLTESACDFMHVFVTDMGSLNFNWRHWKVNLKKDGALWVSWPKGSSQITTNLNGNIVRQVGLDGGLVDVKVCAIDNDWSGLKFMYRKKDR